MRLFMGMRGARFTRLRKAAAEREAPPRQSKGDCSTEVSVHLQSDHLLVGEEASVVNQLHGHVRLAQITRCWLFDASSVDHNLLQHENNRWEPGARASFTGDGSTPRAIAKKKSRNVCG